MLPTASSSKKRKAQALQESSISALKESSNRTRSMSKASPKKTHRTGNPTPKSTTQPRSISKIVDDVFAKATDTFVEKQRRGSTVPKSDVQKEIMRHYRPKGKVESLGDDEVSIHDEPVDESEDPGNHEHGSPGPAFQAANSKLGGKTFLKEPPLRGKGKTSTRSATAKSASPKPGKPVRFGHIAFLPVAPKVDRARISTLRLPNLIHLGVLCKAGLLIDPVPGESSLTIPVTAKQPEISAYVKQRLPLAFRHLPSDNAWQLLVVARRKLAKFGSKKPSGADFATAAGARGAQLLEKTIFLAPRESFPNEVIKEFKPSIQDVVEHLQGGTVPTRRSKRLSVEGSGPESDTNSAADSDDDDDDGDDNIGNDDDGNDDGGNDGNDDNGNDYNGVEDNGNNHDSIEDISDEGDGIEDSDGNEDVNADAYFDAEDGDVEGDGETGGDGDESEGSASIRPPKKKRRRRTAGIRRLVGSDAEGMDGDSFPADQTPPHPHRKSKGKENSAIYVSSSSPSSERDNLWFNAGNYEPTMPFLNLR
ncbi:hypothetical protein FS837_000421 [Tulasnella sp. UAMH 9824]|nr:hypothetical protein FS837_000421 [Tulasnella sp. UAMH 9824]